MSMASINRQYVCNFRDKAIVLQMPTFCAILMRHGFTHGEACIITAIMKISVAVPYYSHY